MAQQDYYAVLGVPASASQDEIKKQYRKLAAKSLARGVKCVLATQVVVDGRRTAWCQQHDALTLKPTPSS